MPIAFAVTIVRLKVDISSVLSPMNLTFTQGHNGVSKLTTCFNLYFNINISDFFFLVMVFKRGRRVDVCMGYILMVISMTLTFMQGGE